jgi:PAS domain S-box-containing protein
MNDITSLQCENEALRRENRTLKSQANSAIVDLEDELKYKETQIQFRTVFETSMLANKIISSDLRIIKVNQAMVELLGYSPEELIGKRITEYTPVEFRGDWQKLQHELWLKHRARFGLETCLIKKDGSTVWVHVSSILFQDNDKEFGYTIIEDCTEKHFLRQQKEEFINIASHELKTPITSLQLRLQMMNRLLKADDDVNEKVFKLSKEAEAYTSKLAYLVGDLLNFSKLEQGEIPLNRSRFKLSDIIDGCCTHIQLVGSFSIKYTGDHSLEVYADMLKIDQVIINFVSNAIKHAPQSKEILVNVEVLGKLAKVSVTDKGDGISPENLLHIFERYYRINRLDNMSSGLGLGLFISSEIINQHGGTIGVESQVGEGSTFWFTIPIE